MEREIPFEEIPEKMQNDWCKFLSTWKGENIKILSIRRCAFDFSNAVDYKIYFDFAGAVGVAIFNIFNNGATFDTCFMYMSTSDIKELYRLSDRLK